MSTGFRFLSTTAALLALGTGAQAQSAGEGLYHSGFVELAYTTFGRGDSVYGAGDVRFGFAPPGGGIGFDAGLEALTDFSNEQHGVTYALTWSGNFGKVSIGNPRSAVDTYMGSRLFEGHEFLRLSQLGSITGSTHRMATLQYDYGTLGIGYDHTVGNLSYGATLHRISPTATDLTDLGFGMTYRLDATTLRMAMEWISSSGDTRTGYHLGGEHAFGQATAGVQLDKTAFSSDSFASVYGNYQFSDAIRASGTVTIPVEHLGDAILGASVRYDMPSGVYVNGAIGGGDVDAFATASVGFNF